MTGWKLSIRYPSHHSNQEEKLRTIVLRFKLDFLPRSYEYKSIIKNILSTIVSVFFKIIWYITFFKARKNRNVMHSLQNWAWATASRHHSISISLYLNNATKPSQFDPNGFYFDFEVIAVIFEVSFILLFLTRLVFMLMPPNLDGCWIMMLSICLPNFIAKFWQGTNHNTTGEGAAVLCYWPIFLHFHT